MVPNWYIMYIRDLYYILSIFIQVWQYINFCLAEVGNVMHIISFTCTAICAAATRSKLRLDMIYATRTDNHWRMFVALYETILCLSSLARSGFQQISGSPNPCLGLCSESAPKLFWPGKWRGHLYKYPWEWGSVSIGQAILDTQPCSSDSHVIRSVPDLSCRV